VIVVVDPAEVVGFQTAGQKTGFARNAFHLAAVAAERKSPIAEQPKAGAFVRRGEPLFGDGHADASRHTLSEQTYSGLDDEASNEEAGAMLSVTEGPFKSRVFRAGQDLMSIAAPYNGVRSAGASAPPQHLVSQLLVGNTPGARETMAQTPLCAGSDEKPASSRITFESSTPPDFLLKIGRACGRSRRSAVVRPLTSQPGTGRMKGKWTTNRRRMLGISSGLAERHPVICRLPDGRGQSDIWGCYRLRSVP
jgi:hypothetical protein